MSATGPVGESARSLPWPPGQCGCPKAADGRHQEPLDAVKLGASVPMPLEVIGTCVRCGQPLDGVVNIDATVGAWHEECPPRVGDWDHDWEPPPGALAPTVRPDPDAPDPRGATDG